MPSPKHGTAGSPVAPSEPQSALEADTDNPGKVEEIKAAQRQTQAGKYGSKEAKPYKSPATTEERTEKKSWIAIKMVDEASKPVTGLAFRIVMPDGETVSEGTLDDKGEARIDGILPGSCKVTFPTLDKEAWKKA